MLDIELNIRNLREYEVEYLSDNSHAILSRSKRLVGCSLNPIYNRVDAFIQDLYSCNDEDLARFIGIIESINEDNIEESIAIDNAISKYFNENKGEVLFSLEDIYK